MTYKLLIVDDEMPNTRLLERLFRDDYFCLTASSGDEAIKLLDQHDVAVIVTDQRMSPMTGIELLKKTADRRPHMVRILLTGYTDVYALMEAINCGLVYTYVSKPWNNEDLKLRVGRAVQHYEDNKRRHALVAANERLSTRLKDMKLGFIRAFAGVLKLNDEYTYAHGSRVGKIASIIGKKIGLGDELLTNLTAAAFFQGLLLCAGTVCRGFAAPLAESLRLSGSSAIETRGCAWRLRHSLSFTGVPGKAEPFRKGCGKAAVNWTSAFFAVNAAFFSFLSSNLPACSCRLLLPPLRLPGLTKVSENRNHYPITVLSQLRNRIYEE